MVTVFSSSSASVPAPRICPLDLPPDHTRLREAEPVSRVTLASGQEAWLVTRYDDVRAVLVDPELFSSDRRQPGKPKRSFNDAVVDSIIFMDPPDHSRLRGLVAGSFTAKKISSMAQRVQDITDELLDDMESVGNSADLATALNQPVPLRVICEILGVPYEDRDAFNAWIDVVTNFGERAEDEFKRAIKEFRSYIDRLVAVKKREPNDDLLSQLIEAHEVAEALSNEELVDLAVLLVIAGHDNTAATLGLAEVMLLTHPEQFTAIRADPAMVASAVEEVLRHQAIVHLGRPRMATRDCELGGVRIRRGEAVVAMLPTANRDPRAFDDPERFDIRRSPNPHLGFGHGIHHCIGHALARMELRIVLGSLAARFPALRLTVAVDKLRWRSDYNAYGVHAVPVTW